MLAALSLTMVREMRGAGYWRALLLQMRRQCVKASQYFPSVLSGEVHVAMRTLIHDTGGR